MRLKLLLPVLALVSWTCSWQALAGMQLAVQSAGDFNTSNYGVASSPSVLVGFRVTSDVAGSPFQLGVTYEHDDLNYGDGNGGGLRFLGAITHIRTGSPVFYDVQAGIDQRDTVGVSFSWGAAVGYTYPLATSVDIAPCLGYRFVPDGGLERSLMNLGVLLTLKVP
jgi:hypothetical protein